MALFYTAREIKIREFFLEQQQEWALYIITFYKKNMKIWVEGVEK